MPSLCPLESPLQVNESAGGSHQTQPAYLGDHRCLSCILDRMTVLLDTFEATPSERSELITELATRYGDHGHQLPPTDFLRESYHALSAKYKGFFPFWDRKKLMNDRALELQSALRVRVRMGSNSFRNALRIALVGTRIEFYTDNT